MRVMVQFNNFVCFIFSLVFRLVYLYAATYTLRFRSSSLNPQPAQGRLTNQTFHRFADAHVKHSKLTPCMIVVWYECEVEQ